MMEMKLSMFIYRPSFVFDGACQRGANGMFAVSVPLGQVICNANLPKTPQQFGVKSTFALHSKEQDDREVVAPRINIRWHSTSCPLICFFTLMF